MANYYKPTRIVAEADLFDGRLAKYGIRELPRDPSDDPEVRYLRGPDAAVRPEWKGFYNTTVMVCFNAARHLSEVGRPSMELAKALCEEFDCELIDYHLWYPDEIFYSPEALAAYNAAMDLLPVNNFTAEQFLGVVEAALREFRGNEDCDRIDKSRADRLCGRIDTYGEDDESRADRLCDRIDVYDEDDESRADRLCGRIDTYGEDELEELDNARD